LAAAVHFPCHFGTLAAGAGVNSSLYLASIITKQIRREGEAYFLRLKVEVDQRSSITPQLHVSLENCAFNCRFLKAIAADQLLVFTSSMQNPQQHCAQAFLGKKGTFLQHDVSLSFPSCMMVRPRAAWLVTLIELATLQG